MPRPRKDGSVAASPNRVRLTPFYVAQAKPRSTPFHTWDVLVRGLSLLIQPSGHRSWRFFYARKGPRWVHIGDAAVIPIAEARATALDLALKVARGGDPAADKAAQRNAGTFQQLAADYVERYASKNNKSYRQAQRLVDRYLLPHWAKLKPADITRKDVRAVLDRIAAPILSNQVRHAASAIFSWAVEQDLLASNPVTGIRRNATKSRERILSETEVSAFWTAFNDLDPYRGAALKLILLTSARPGEVSHMRAEHIEPVEGGLWWHLPGQPDNKGWVGTKSGRDHKLWLSTAARAVLSDLDGEGFVLGGRQPVTYLDQSMRDVCARLKINNAARPHDLRRTAASLITKLGHGRQAMDRILAHTDRSVGSVYDRTSYEAVDRAIMESIGAHVMSLVEGRADEKVVSMIRK